MENRVSGILIQRVILIYFKYFNLQQLLLLYFFFLFMALRACQSSTLYYITPVKRYNITQLKNVQLPHIVIHILTFEIRSYASFRVNLKAAITPSNHLSKGPAFQYWQMTSYCRKSGFVIYFLDYRISCFISQVI